jgi:hypothetical protein
MAYYGENRVALVVVLATLFSFLVFSESYAQSDVKPDADAQGTAELDQIENPRSKSYKLFLLGGQSNMDGCGRAEELPESFQAPPTNVITWDNRKQCWVPLTRDSMAIARHQQFGPEMAFAHRMAEAYPDQMIAITKTSAGGTKLHTQWTPGKGMYQAFLRNFNNATRHLDEIGVDYEISGMLWMQGESDSETTEMANAYEENLKRMIVDIRVQTNNETLPFVMGRISSSLLKETPWVFDQAEIVQAAQESVTAEDEHVLIINTDDLSTLKDNTHFDTEAQLTLGAQMADVMIQELTLREEGEPHDHEVRP